MKRVNSWANHLLREEERWTLTHKANNPQKVSESLGQRWVHFKNLTSITVRPYFYKLSTWPPAHLPETRWKIKNTVRSQSQWSKNHSAGLLFCLARTYLFLRISVCLSWLVQHRRLQVSCPCTHWYCRCWGEETPKSEGNRTGKGTQPWQGQVRLPLSAARPYCRLILCQDR